MRSTTAPVAVFLACRAEAQSDRPQPLSDLDARLLANDRPLPDLAGYDALIGGTL